jgi:hypothetical protein
MNLCSIKKYLDPKWKFCVLKKAVDDVDDEIWGFTETEEFAKSEVEAETEAYGNIPEFQFYYEKI